MKDWLEEKCFYFIGDSAYALLAYFLIPYDDGEPGCPKDAFNYWHSRSRITIECAFGELIMRWGIFLRTLRFDLRQINKIIRATMLLHNFIVDQRGDDDEQDTEYFSNFSVQNMIEQHNTSPEVADPLVMENDAPRPRRGRLDCEEFASREEGELRRLTLTAELRAREMGRHLPSERVRYNNFGHPYVI